MSVVSVQNLTLSFGENTLFSNVSFDVYEKEIVEDVVSTRIPEEWTREDVYE